MEPILGGTAPPAGGAELIKNGSTASFMADVVDASHEAAIVVDFWAPWCEPCKQLGPMLERAVKEAKGAVRLVKIDIDKNQQLAQQMRVQSIPAVYAFKDGRPVDAFVGALPESQVKQFVARLGGAKGPSPIEEAVALAKEAVAAGDSGRATTLFTQVLQHEPENVDALAGLARAAVAKKDFAKARQLLARVPASAANHADVAAARAGLELAEAGAKAQGALGELRQRLERDPNDHQARFDLAAALFAAGEREPAVDELLELVRRDRQWNEQAARRQLVKFFEAMGPTDPLTQAARRRLSSHSLLMTTGFVPRFKALPASLPIFPLTGALLLPRGELPLNIFEPRYLAMIRDALAGDRLIGMVQPLDAKGNAGEPPVYRTGCAGRLTSFSETADGRYLITLTGLLRFDVAEELPRDRLYRRVAPDWRRYRGDLTEQHPPLGRERFLAALKPFFARHDITADWEAMATAADERLVTVIAMLGPFAPSEKQALLEAADTAERARLLTALLEMSARGGDAGDARARH